MSFLKKHSLSARLTFSLWLVFLVIITSIGLYDYNRQINNIKQSNLNSMLAISKSISAAVTEDIYTNNFVSLEQTLLGLNEISEIDSISVYKNKKEFYSEIVRDTKGTLIPRYEYDGTSKIITKEFVGYNPDDSMIVRTRIQFSSLTIAWIEFYSNKSILKDIKTKVALELFFLCGSILIVTFLGVLIFLQRRLHTLNELIDFSKLLPLANGKTINLNDAPSEIQSLADSLNWASEEIEKQSKLLQDKNISLEHLVSERTKELEAAKDTAEKASMAKTDFLSRMSHELRTPMNAILGFGQILALKSSGLNEQQHQNTMEILNAGNHLLTLINDILDLATIESGNVNISIQAVHLTKVLQQSANLVKHQAKTRQIKLIDNVSQSNFIVNADPLLLKQVLINLLSNAVKYNNQKGKIIIDAESINGQHLRLSISDTGSGLSKEDLKKLFSSFERLNADSRTEGTGIGLAITKHLIDAMGGAIGVESTIGEGSIFWIELPIHNE